MHQAGQMKRRARRTKPRPPRPDGFTQWAEDRFEIANLWGVESETAERVEIVNGFVYRGLGLYQSSATKARYRRKDGTRRVYETWVITHLNTGHAVRTLFDCPAPRAFMLATDLADMADWTFDGLDGWKNTCPDMPDLLQDWHRRHELKGMPAGGGRDESVAQAIGMKRW
jgi:hypothetical protein